VEEFIVSFEQLAFRMEGVTYALFREFFISGLKDEICAHVLMDLPQTWLEATKWAKEAQQFVSSQTRKTPFIPCPKNPLPYPPATPLKIQKLTQDEMVECQLKGIYYNYDDKYFSGHKCKEHNFFIAMYEDFSEEVVDVSHVPKLPPLHDINPPSYPLKVEPFISMNSLTGFSSLQTLKSTGYIKN